MDQLDSNSLVASEILLLILFYLDLCQLVICRRVCKQLLQLIDHNQLFWRTFEWTQGDREVFRPATIDMFDQKSGSTIERISFVYRNNDDEVAKHLITTLKRSKATLKHVYFRVYNHKGIQDQILDLATSSPNLESLVAWDSHPIDAIFPLSHLVCIDRKLCTNAIQRQASRLKVLWIHNGVEAISKMDTKLFKSLISFSQSEDAESGPSYETLSKFSETLVHLKIRIDLDDSISKPLFCPHLKVFEGGVEIGLSSFFDAPKLQVVVLEFVHYYDFMGIPVSVEEIWLRSRKEDLRYEDWEPLLLLSCPRLRLLKLMKNFIIDFCCDRFLFEDFLLALEDRKTLVDGKGEVDGIKMASINTLVLPTDLFDEDELDRARELVGEVVDVKDYREFIEIEY